MLEARDFQGAWNLLRPTFRANLNYNNWVAGYANTRAVRPTSVSTTAQSVSTAAVAVTLTAVDQAGAGTVTRTFQGAWNLVTVNGEWKLNSADIKAMN